MTKKRELDLSTGRSVLTECATFMGSKRVDLETFDTLTDALMYHYHKDAMRDAQLRHSIPDWQKFAKKKGLLIEQRYPREKRVLLTSPLLQVIRGGNDLKGRFHQYTEKLWNTPHFAPFCILEHRYRESETWLEGSPDGQAIWVSQITNSGHDMMPCTDTTTSNLIRVRDVHYGSVTVLTTMVTDRDA